jgi:hypothetical protein
MGNQNSGSVRGNMEDSGRTQKKNNDKQENQESASQNQASDPGLKPRSLVYAERGISTSQDVAKVLSALACDILDDRVTPNKGNSFCSAIGKMLDNEKLAQKYGRPDRISGRKVMAYDYDGSLQSLPQPDESSVYTEESSSDLEVIRNQVRQLTQNLSQVAQALGV